MRVRLALSLVAVAITAESCTQSPTPPPANPRCAPSVEIATLVAAHSPGEETEPSLAQTRLAALYAQATLAANQEITPATATAAADRLERELRSEIDRLVAPAPAPDPDPAASPAPAPEAAEPLRR